MVAFTAQVPSPADAYPYFNSSHFKTRNMKLPIIVIHFLVVASVLVPYLLFILSARREITRLNHQFSLEARKLKLKPEEKEHWNNNVIGLDKDQLKILFLQKRSASIVSFVIDLKQVQACKFVEQRRNLLMKKRKEEVLEKIDLHLLLNNGSIEQISLYDC